MPGFIQKAYFGEDLKRWVTYDLRRFSKKPTRMFTWESGAREESQSSIRRFVWYIFGCAHEELWRNGSIIVVIGSFRPKERVRHLLFQTASKHVFPLSFILQLDEMVTFGLVNWVKRTNWRMSESKKIQFLCIFSSTSHVGSIVCEFWVLQKCL